VLLASSRVLHEGVVQNGVAWVRVVIRSRMGSRRPKQAQVEIGVYLSKSLHGHSFI
jgi:hypothetical protein